MKKFFVPALCAVLSTGLVGCSDDDDVVDVPVIDPVVPTTEFDYEAYYKGDIYGNGAGNLWINFIEKSLTYDEDEGDFTGTGDLLCLDFFTTLASNPDFATLANGTYTASDDYSEFTLNMDDYETYVVKYVDSTPTEYSVTGGTVTVTNVDGYTSINASLTLNDGSDYEFHFVDKISVINRSGSGNMSNLTENVAVTGLTQGVAMYFGESFTETSDHYMVVLAGEDYDLEENYGLSPSLMIGLNVTPGSSDGIPSGTYTLIDAMEADDYEVGTALSGVYDPTLGGFFGTWYFHTASAIEASMMTGTVKVTNNGDGKYAIEFDLKDGYGHSVKGSYNGALDVEDLS